MLGKAKNMNSENNVLPQDFDGVFRFTNFTDKDFKAKWDNVEYTFPAKSTTPLVMNATPQEIQHIRKKFARELAIQEFSGSDKMKALDKLNPIGLTSFQGAVTYTDNDLTDFVQRCLEPLPVAQAKVKVLPKQDESNFKKDEEGNNVTEVLDHKSKKSFLAKGSGIVND